MLCIALFFFVKQKTAYEMRISDWSSDVCSSDLRQRGLGDVGRQHDAPLRTRVEHPVLVARGQPRVQRQDLGVAVLAVFQRLMRVADLALPGKEDQRVPHRPFTRDIVSGGPDAAEPRDGGKKGRASGGRKAG